MSKSSVRASDSTYIVHDIRGHSVSFEKVRDNNPEAIAGEVVGKQLYEYGPRLAMFKMRFERDPTYAIILKFISECITEIYHGLSFVVFTGWFRDIAPNPCDVGKDAYNTYQHTLYR